MDFLGVLGSLGDPEGTPDRWISSVFLVLWKVPQCTPNVLSLCPCRPKRNVATMHPGNVRFSIGFTTKVETCAIMERETRKVQEKEHTGNRIEEVASSYEKPERNRDRQKGIEATKVF